MNAKVSVCLGLLVLCSACSGAGSSGTEPSTANPGEENNEPGQMDASGPPQEDAADDDGGDVSSEPDAVEPPQGPYVIEDPGHTSDTASQLEAFYREYGGREAFPSQHVSAFEALLWAEDDLGDGELDEARQRVESVFAVQPRGDRAWFLGSDEGTGGSNVGHPVAYYGLRMVEQVVAMGAPGGAGTLQMTAVVAPCAAARRPRLPDLQPEVVNVDLNPAILANEARRLFLATNLFRRWLASVTQGMDIQLSVYVMDECTTVDFTDDGSTIVSYPDAQSMVDAVEAELAGQTDIWWVVTPSGVVGTETETGRHFITGGMGLTNDGRPLILSDDLWFVRKPDHMGSGQWTEVELRAYHPQWFQHEFMHHLFRAWPQFELEINGHDWFDRATWPEDFEGIHEADYYTEAINKRLLTASPSLAEGLQAPEVVDASDFELADFMGQYQRLPVANEWHEVAVVLEGDALRWTNAAGVSWSLHVRGDELWTGSDCPYGESKLSIEVADGRISALRFGGEAYVRVD